MLYFKACPRCEGDINVRTDWYGEYMECLQCGWSKDTDQDVISRLSDTREALIEQAVAKKAS